jgi:NAD+ kinase
MKRKAKIGIFVNADKPLAGEALKILSDIAEKGGIDLFAEPEAVALAGGGAAWTACTAREMADNATAVAVLGGDGTLLRAIHRLQELGADLPAMGFNIGSLGYLTGADEEHFGEALEALASGTVEISDRQMLSCRVCSGGDSGVCTLPRSALNDVVLSRSSGRMVRIGLALDGQSVTTYACDGLIASTPTGSTAYSLSAGGPLVMPGAAATVVTVICPHTLGSRPLVVADTARISFRVDVAETPLPLTIDGEDTDSLAAGDEVEIFRSPRSARIAFLPDHNDYLALSRKLGWAGQMARGS